MKKLFFPFSLLVIVLNIQSQNLSKTCSVSMNLYRANMKPIANKLVTFKSDDEKHHVEIITKEDGFCKVNLNQNTHYNIIFQNIFYTKMFKIPKSYRLDFNGPILIDGGLFTTIKLEVFDNEGNYDLLKQEKIQCESITTGVIYRNKTNQSGIVEFYVPRNSSYTFHSEFEKDIQKINVGNGQGVSVYTVLLKANTTPENQYYLRIKKAENEAIAREKQFKLEDSLKGTIPINVILFLNIELKDKNGEFHHFGEISVYDSHKKNKLLGVLHGNWNIEGLCEKGMRLCTRSITNADGSYTDAVLPIKLKRGTHELYIENSSGILKKTVEVDVKIQTSYGFLKNNFNDYSVTAPLCLKE